MISAASIAPAIICKTHQYELTEALPLPRFTHPFLSLLYSVFAAAFRAALAPFANGELAC